MMEFYKMHGCGNDIILFNCLESEIKNPEELAVKLCDRHKSIGGDGLVLVLPSTVADAKMRMFNIDGTESENCGNSIRCVGKFLYDNGIISDTNIKIETLSGVKDLELIIENGRVSAAKVNMGAARLKPEEIPINYNLTGSKVVDRKVKISSKDYHVTCVSMGNPHAIIFPDDIEHFDLPTIGSRFEKSDIFPERVNLGIAEKIKRNHMQMRVWERGSGETKSSGTSACAGAVAAVLLGYGDKNTDIKVELAGGRLLINYTDEAVYLTGDCVTIFKGMIEL